MKFENFDIKTLQQGDNYQRLTANFTIKSQLSTRDIKPFNKVTIINLWQNLFLQQGDNYQPLTANLYKATAIDPWQQNFTRRQPSTLDIKLYKVTVINFRQQTLQQDDTNQPLAAKLLQRGNQQPLTANL